MELFIEGAENPVLQHANLQGVLQRVSDDGFSLDRVCASRLALEGVRAPLHVASGRAGGELEPRPLR